MPPRKTKKAAAAQLKEGEYPSTVVAANESGVVAIPTTTRIPLSDRPIPAIKSTPLMDFLLPTFEGLNIKGRTGIDALIHLCRMGAHRYDKLRKFCAAWEDLHQPNIWRELFPLEEFTTPTLEQACQIANIENDDFIADLSRMVYHYGGELAKWRVQLSMNEVIDSAIEVALSGGPRGHQDRKMLLQAGGLIQEGPGTVVNVNNQQVTNNIAGLPQWEESDRLAQKVLLEKRTVALPPATVANVVEAEIIDVEEAISATKES